MAIRHRRQFPVGSSPDSIQWDEWNADHEGGDNIFSPPIPQSDVSGLEAALAASGGIRLIGPIAVDFTDIPVGADGTKIDILTLPVGTAIIDWQVDPDTFIPWDSVGTVADGYLGQGAAWTPEGSAAGVWGEPLRTGAQVGTVPCARLGVEDSERIDLSGVAVRTSCAPLVVTQDDTPIQIWWSTGGSPPDPATVGHCDFYFLVAMPVAP